MAIFIILSRPSQMNELCFVCACVCMCACVCVMEETEGGGREGGERKGKEGGREGGRTEDNIQCHPQECHPPVWRQGLSLARSSPISLE